MNQRDNPLFWSFSLGNWLSTNVRVSWYFPLLWVFFLLRFGATYGSAVSLILFVSVLLHEYGHVIAARKTGGQADEILIWPLGGLAFVQPYPSFWSQFWTSAAGPLVNLVICAATLPHVMSTEYANYAWNPFLLPIPKSDFGAHFYSDLAVVTFSLNWMALVVNLVPACPLDGGQILRSILIQRWGKLTGIEWSAKISIVAAICLALVGMFQNDMVWLFGLAMFLALMAFQDLQRLQMSDFTEDSVFGYDFSQGYTSLERTLPASSTAPTLSYWERRRQKREAEKKRVAEEQDREAEALLDSILAKLHEQGRDSLTTSEKRILERASEKFRKGRSTTD